jgi:hypothetical protein
LDYDGELGDVHGVLPRGNLKLEDTNYFCPRAVKGDGGDLAARFRIEFNGIHTLRSIENGLVGHCAVGVGFNLARRTSSAPILFLNRSL